MCTGQLTHAMGSASSVRCVPGVISRSPAAGCKRMTVAHREIGCGCCSSLPPLALLGLAADSFGAGQPLTWAVLSSHCSLCPVPCRVWADSGRCVVER